MEKFEPIGFIAAFAGLWFVVTTFLSLMSGWWGLSRAYPDRPQTVIRRLSNISGSMGAGVHLNGILTLEACQGGLRIRMWRLFGPFNAPIFVPWNDIRVVRRNRILWQTAVLELGRPRTGQLKIQAYLADKLGMAAGGQWPEGGRIVRETAAHAALQVGAQWLIITALFSTFYILGSQDAGYAPPIWVAIGFPAIVFGIVSVVRLLRRLS